MRKALHVIVQGKDIPPPVTRFTDFKLPRVLLKHFEKKGIVIPSAIQAQGLPVALSGRDLVGIAYTGSGKTLVFALPALMWSLQEEARCPLRPGEGPIAVIMAPSRELARQTADQCREFAEVCAQDPKYPAVRVMCCIGGEPIRAQMEVLAQGCHIVVATPGRLLDHLDKYRMNLSLCKYIALDEGDHMLDARGFEEELTSIQAYATRQRQTLLFSATMPEKVQAFARSSLLDPIVVNVNRAGAASLDIAQHVQYVQDDSKMVALLPTLQKTAPPVIIFAENKRDVDDINEYLLLKGVAATSIHGDKSQPERAAAIDAFRAGDKDVLIATDVAAKGLDFPSIQHVINYDMPTEMETYIHRIGRTGRSGKTGTATTFVNARVPESSMLELKHLLMEAKQVIPPVLAAIDDPDEAAFLAGVDKRMTCPYCSGFHRLSDCPRAKRDAAAFMNRGQDGLTE